MTNPNGAPLDRRRSRRANLATPPLTPTPSVTAKSPDKGQQILKDFARSLSEVLIDITALEVNTMVVERITGDKFMPWEIYRDVYRIDESWLYRDEKGPTCNLHYSLSFFVYSPVSLFLI